MAAGSASQVKNVCHELGTAVTMVHLGALSECEDWLQHQAWLEASKGQITEDFTMRSHVRGWKDAITVSALDQLIHALSIMPFSSWTKSKSCEQGRRGTWPWLGNPTEYSQTINKSQLEKWNGFTLFPLKTKREHLAYSSLKLQISPLKLFCIIMLAFEHLDEVLVCLS